MIRRVLYQIAGVDRATLETCPATDKVWAAHLGFSLTLSFVVVLGISFHATGYMIADPGMRALVSLVIALTVFMFDRALYQSDWFYQGFLWQSAPGLEGEGGGRSGRRFLRIGIRLAMSFGLAWVIAVFLELAIFSDTISDKIKRDHVTVNQPVYQKIEQYQAGLSAEIEQRRKSLAALEAVYRDDLAAAGPVDTPEPAQVNEFEQQIKALDAQEAELRNELRQIQEQIRVYAADMNAEQLGQRINAGNSGRAGAGPRFQFARQQKEVYEQQRAARESEIAQLRAKRDDFRAAQARVAADVATRREQARAAAQSKRDALRAQVDVARAGLKDLEASLLPRVEDFRQKALAASDFQKQKDDPLSRMTAYQELKSDPKDGDTVTLFSWMTKFLIIFLEIVPVVAKLFFSPPSVYAAKIQAEVQRERRRVQREMDAEASSESEIEARMAEIAATIRHDMTSPKASAPELAPEGLWKTPESRRPVVEPASVPPRVPPAREERLKEERLKEERIKEERIKEERLKEERIKEERIKEAHPEPKPARVVAPVERDLEAERRREMEQLISEETVRHAGTRAAARRPGEPGPKREPKELTPLSFLLQDDIPQKP